MTDHKQIVWLASYPKSGNTWVRAFLDAYMLGDVDLNAMVASLTDDVAGLYAVGDGSKPSDLPLNVQYLMRPAAMVRLVRMHLADDVRSRIPLVVKTHNPHLVANGIELIPEALTKAVVHIVRDPRDVLPSYAKHMGQDLDQALEWMDDELRHLKGSEHRMSDLISSWDKHTLSYLNADTHNVRTFLFEDMRANPVEQFSEILRHIGLEPDADRVATALDAVKLEKLREKEQRDGFNESSPHAKNQFFGTGEVGGWRNKIEPRHSHKIERKFGRVMKRLGYTTNLKAVR